MTHITDNHDALLDYLYEEGDPGERLAIAKHLQECAPCAVAVLEFQNVRGMLSDWTPPGSQLGFRVVREAEGAPGAPSMPVATREKSWGWGPTTKGMLQAAAAIVIFVSGMAASQLDVEYRDGTVIVRMQSDAPVTPPDNIRNDSIMLYPESLVSVPDAPSDINSGENERDRLLQRVRSMIDQSEQRQQRELALRLSQVTREVDTQHQADLLKIQQDFGQQQEATIDYLVRTSGGVK